MQGRGVGEDSTIHPTGVERKEQSKTVKHNEKRKTSKDVKLDNWNRTTGLEQTVKIIQQVEII